MNYMAKYNELMDMIGHSREYQLEKILLLEAKRFNIDFENSIFYIQNLFLESKKSRLFIFSPEKVILLSIEDDKECLIGGQFSDRKYIKNFWYGKKYYDEQYQITFKLNDTDCVLTPNIDTNSHHAGNYNKIAIDIIDYFIKSN